MQSINSLSSGVINSWPKVIYFAGVDYVANEILARPFGGTLGYAGHYLLGGAAMTTKMLIWSTM